MGMDMDQVELDAAYDQRAYAPLIGRNPKVLCHQQRDDAGPPRSSKRLAYGHADNRSA